MECVLCYRNAYYWNFGFPRAPNNDKGYWVSVRTDINHIVITMNNFPTVGEVFTKLDHLLRD